MRTFSTTAIITTFITNALRMVLGFFTNLFHKTSTFEILPSSIYKGKGYLKAWMMLILLGVSGGVVGQTALVSWDMSGVTSGSATAPTAINNSKITVNTNLLRNSIGGTVSSIARGYGSAGWANITADDAIMADDFMSFKISANTGFAISLTSVDPLSYRRTSTGPANGELRYSINGDLFSGISSGPFAFGSTSTSGASVTPFSLSGDFDLQQQKQSIEMILVPYNSSNNSGTFYIYDTGNSTASDFTINGRVLGSTTTSLSSFYACLGSAGTPQSFVVQGDGLASSNVVLTAPTDYEVSTDNITFAASVVVTPSSGSVNQTIYVRLKSNATAGSHSGTVTIIGGGFTSVASLGVLVSGDVRTVPAVNSNPVASSITYGDNTSFTLSATSYVTATYQWQVSTNNGSSWNNVSGGIYSNETTTTLNVTKPTVAMTGYLYRCVVTNPCGSSNSEGGSLTVNAVALTITGLTANNKPYDGTTSATLSGTPSYVGLVGSETFTVTGTPSASFATPIVGTGKAVTVTGYTAPNSNYTVSQPTGLSADIETVALTITGLTANNKSYDGTTSATLSGTPSYVGLVGSETFTVTGTPSASFATPIVGTAKAVTVTGYTAPNSNYTVSQPMGLSADIDAKTLTGNFTADNKVYDGNNSATVLARALTGVVGSEIVTLIGGTATFDSHIAGPGKIVTLTGATLFGADAGNYTLSSVNTSTANIAQKSLTITANNRNKCEGTIATFIGTEFTTIGLVAGDAVTSVTLTSTGSPSTATKSSPGPDYPIVISAAVGLGLSNYNISYVNGTLTITSPTLVMIPSPAPCFGDLGGAILQATGGSGGGYVFTSNPTTGVTITGNIMTAPAGVYIVTVRDGAGCTKAGTLTISQPDQITGSGAKKSYNGSDLSCATATDGEITVTASGGTGTKQYSINNGAYQTSNVFSGLAAGVHTLKVKDANGCEVSLPSVTITAPAAVVTGTPFSTKVDVNCFGGNNGSIDLTVPDATGGTGTKIYTYVWAKALTPAFTANTQDITGLSAGIYSVTITATDANGCTATTGLAVTITEPSVLTATVAGTNAVCFGGTGSIAVTAPNGGTGTTPTYEYSKDNGANWQTSGSFTGLVAGIYQISIRDAAVTTCIIDLDGSVGTTITQPAILSATVNTTNAVCYGGMGSISVTSPSGGAGTIPTYEFSKDNGANWQSTGSFTGLIAGIYQISIRDAAVPTCIIDLDGSTGTTITEPAILSAIVTPTNAVCFGGTGSIVVNSTTGGAGTYEYSKDNGANWQTSGSFTGLLAGIYQISIRDAAVPTCIIDLDGSTGTTITEPAILSATVTPTNAVCFGGAGSIAVISPSGGTGTIPTYEFSKDNGANWQSSGSFTGLIAGTYQISIRDAAVPTCIIDLDGSVGTTISQPSVLTATVTGTNAICFGGTGSVTVITPNGGAGTYEYSKDNGANWQSSGSFTGLIAWTYQISIRDAAVPTCIIDLDGSAGTTITQPDAITTSTATKVDVTCIGGTNGEIHLVGAGGTGVYSYTITGTGSNTTGAASGNFTGLIAGTYNYSITDANTCTPATGTLIVGQPYPMTVSNITADVCPGSAIVFDVTSTNNDAYDFNWTAKDANNNTLGGDSFVNLGTEAVNTTLSLSCALTINNPITFTFTPSTTGGCVGTPITRTVNVRDLVAPTFTKPADITIFTDSDCNYVSSPTITGDVTDEADNCSTGLIATFTDAIANGTFAGTKIITRTWSLVDACGNAAAAQDQIITVNDNIAPVITTCPFNQLNIAAASGCSATPTWTPVATDNCSGTISYKYYITGHYASGSISALIDGTGSGATFTAGGVSTVHLIAVDESGNKSTECTFDISVSPATFNFTALAATDACEGTGSTISMTTGLAQGTSVDVIYSINGGADVIKTTTVGTGGAISFMTDPLATTDNTIAIKAINDPAISCGLTFTTGNSTSLLVNSKPTGESVTLPAICSGTAVGYTLTTNNSVNSTFSWVGAAPSMPVFVSGFSTTPQIGSTITDVLTSIDIIGGLQNVVYTVTPTSVTGSCVGTPFTITVPVKPTLFGSINGNNSICIGGSTNLSFSTPPFIGAATITYNDGTSNQTVSLPTGGIVNVPVSPTATTTYTLVSITANGCTKALSGSVTVTVNSLPTLTVVNPAAVCSPATVDITTSTVQTTNTGTITNYYSTNALAMTGGEGDITTPAAIATSGTYYIRSESAAGCYVIESVMVTINSLPTLTVVNPAAVCNPSTVDITTSSVQTANTGTSTNYYSTNSLAMSGGTGDITNPTAIASSSTIYIRSELSTSCYMIEPVTVTVNPLPALTVVNPAAVCNGVTVDITNSSVQTVNTGTTTDYYSTNTLAMAGGTGDITTPTAIAASSTIYIRSELSTGCYVIAPVTVTVNSLPIFTTSSINPSCNGGANGTITVTTSATSPMFSKDNGLNHVAGTSPYIFSSLTDGSYEIRVKDANSCESMASTITLTQPTVIIASAIPTAALCFGGNGSAALSATGGTGTHTFTSSGGTVDASTLTAIAGTYTITATDVNGCTGTVSVTIGQPAAALTATTTKVDVSCKGAATGTATVSATGGTVGTGYTYSWSTSPVQTSATATGLVAGTYTVTVTDANGCTFSPAAVIISEPTLATSITASSNTPVCEASALNLTSTATSSTGGLTYAWTGPNGFAALTQNASVTAVTLAAAGTYTVTVTDGNGCIAMATTAVVINPLPTVFNVSGNPSICSGVASPITLSSSTVGVNYKLTASGFGGSVLAGTGSALVFTPPANILGTYSIEAINTATGCKSMMNGSITTINATNPTISITAQTNVGCKGGNDGSITVVASTGSGSYNYTFNGGEAQPSGVFNTISAGTYSIVANDLNTGCSASTSINITEPLSLPSAMVASSGIACEGNTVTLTANAIGGTSPYTYSWNGATATTVSTLDITSTSTNTLVVTDSKGCVVPTISTAVTFNTPALPTITGSTIICSGSTLSLSTSALGNYVWSGPNTFSSTSPSISITNAQAANVGVYSLTVTDANSCVASATVDVVIHITPAAPTAIVTQPTCTVATGTITVSAPVLGMSYSIDGMDYANTTGAFTGVASGTYSVTAKSAAGCLSPATSVEVNAQPATPAAPTAIVTQPTCTVVTGRITVSAPVLGMTYSIDGTDYSNTTGVFATVATGTYSVTAKSAAGCISPATSVEVNVQPATPAAPTAIVIQPTCTVATGTITVASPVSGTTYSIDGTDYSNTTGVFATVATGTYSVTAKSAAGCISPATSVEVNAQPATPAAPTAIVTQPTCIVAKGTITIASPVSGTTYSIDGITYTNTDGIFTSVISGTYSVTAKSVVGCISPATSVEVNAQPATPAAPTAIVTQPTCTVATGTITIASPVSGTTYSIDGIDYANTTGVFTGVASGTYSVTAKSGDGCVSTATSVTVNAQPATPAAPTAIVIQPTCTVATGTITVSAPVLGMSYSIDGIDYANTTGAFMGVASGTYSVTSKSVDGCVSTATSVEVNAQPATPAAPTAIVTQPTCTIATGTITVASPVSGTTYSIDGTDYSNTTGVFATVATGTYSVTAKSAAGCISPATSVEVNAQPATPAAPTAIVTQPTCTVATGTITVSAPVLGMSYSIDGIDYANTTGAFMGVASGTYSVTSKSVDGCVSTATSVEVNAQPATPAAPTAIVTQPTCTVATGTITVTVPIGTGMTYSIDGTTYTNTDGIFSAVASGAYSVTSKSADGCISTATSVEVNAQPAIPAAPTVSVTQPTCTVETGTITVTAPIGTGMTYSIDGTTYTNTDGIFSAVASGVYSVTSKSADGCISTATSVEVTPDTAPPTVTISGPTALDCTTNTALLTASGGVSYIWTSTSFPSMVLSSTSSLTANMMGNYVVTATGENGCTSTAQRYVMMSFPTGGAISASPSTELTCLNTEIVLSVTGPPYPSYSWSTGVSASTITVNAPGTYSVTIPGFGPGFCPSTATVVITENKVAPEVAITTPTSTVLTCTSPSITLTATGVGTYAWSNGTALGTLATQEVTTAGTYVVTVTGANGCTATASIVITEDKVVPEAAITAPTSTVLTCTSPSITLTATGVGTYAWSNGTALGTLATQEVTTAGTYVVTVTGANGCTATASIVITEDKVAPEAAITTPTSTVLTCTSPSITLTATGAGTYAWSNGTALGTLATQEVTTAGTYAVTVTGANGCTSTASIVITEDKVAPEATITTPTSTVLTCTSPSITLTATGVGTYAWSNGTVLGTLATQEVTTAGTYVVTVTGANGCTATASIVITEDKVAPVLLIINPDPAPSVDITASGVTTGSTLPSGTLLTYHTDAEGTLALGSPEAITIAGTYYIKATSANGCVDIKPVVVTVTNNCPDNLILVSPTDDQSGTGVVKKAGMTIIATNKVSSGANVSYQAGKSITLSPGTEISNGSVFKAEIKGCDN
ncbi:MAG TPA: YDG domain-containing protein [Leadbetterella sp.]|nr:YDG domain-containing protein [Leadbetterella sp.]